MWPKSTSALWSLCALGHRTPGAGTPLSAVFDTVDEARRAAVVADVRDALAGYVDASGMACPMATRIVTARR